MVARKTRTEKDSMGEVQVPVDVLWKAETQRAIENFPIGVEPMPAGIIVSIVLIKRACAKVNGELGIIDAKIAEAIREACDDVLEPETGLGSGGTMDQQFPISVWQTGSGTQTNMNVNEVLATRASKISGVTVHPHDHVNKGQSTNDVFPTALHIATFLALQGTLFPALEMFKGALRLKVEEFSSIIKIGRTHLMDAVPLTLGEEFSGYLKQVEYANRSLDDSLVYVAELPIGGTSVGTGLNAPKEFGEMVVAELCEQTGMNFFSGENRFALQSGKEGLLIVSSALRTLAVALHSIANNIRFLASGPQCGIGELKVPANEPGSSIMPGKVNPTQCEMICMVCAEVMGNDYKIAFAASQTHFQLNTYMPLIGRSLLSSIDLMADAIESFSTRSLAGIEADRKNIHRYVEKSLMLGTALTPHIGYDKAAEIAKKARKEGLTLKESALALGYVTEVEFDEWVDVKKMVI